MDAREPGIRLEPADCEAPVVSVSTDAFVCDDQYFTVEEGYGFGGQEEVEGLTPAEELDAIEREIRGLGRTREKLLPKVRRYEFNRMWMRCVGFSRSTLGPDFFREYPADEYAATLRKVTDEQSALAAEVASYRDARERQAALVEILRARR